MVKIKPLSALFVKVLKTRTIYIGDNLGALVVNSTADCGLCLTI